MGSTALEPATRSGGSVRQSRNASSQLHFAIDFHRGSEVTALPLAMQPYAGAGFFLQGLTHRAARMSLTRQGGSEYILMFFTGSAVLRVNDIHFERGSLP